jgi:hypothetical protein
MTEQSISTPPESPPELTPDANEFRPSVFARTLFLISGVIVPLVCFALGYLDQPDWQSGSASAFATLYLSHTGSMPFYPLLIYNMTSMTLLVINPQRHVSNFWVRFGIYSGVIVALGFWGLFAIAFNSGPSYTEPLSFMTFVSPLGVGIPWAILYGLYVAAKKIKWGNWLILISSLLCLLGVLALPYLCILPLLLSTPWAMASYFTMSFLIFRHRKENVFQFSLAQLLGFVTWFGSYCAAWRVAYLFVLEEYSKLPTEQPPGCYFCSATARGHRRWVKSEDYLAADGRIFRVNDQLRRFKAFEIMLAAICPKWHRHCRSIYDRVGPTMAKTLIHPLLADAAYATLKPLEWLCRAAMFLAVRERDGYLKLYRRSSSDRQCTIQPRG